MARYPMGLSAKNNSAVNYVPDFSDTRVQNFEKDFSGGLSSRANFVDLDEAMAAIAEAEKLISAQRKKIEYLETLALNDELTGLMNRRAFMAALQRELAFCKRDPSANGIVMMIDLDGFKQINDTHGHAAGDAYLAALGAALASEIRPSDIVARLGGDEFAIILTRTAAKPGIVRAREIIKNLNGKSMMWRNTLLPFRASMGLATYAGRDIAEAVMVSADLKLYADKEKRKRG